MKFTKKAIEKIKLPLKDKPYAKIFHDDSLHGFALRVTSKGTKTFIINKKVHGTVFRMNIGRFGVLTVEAARKKAQTYLGQIAEGIDPSQKRYPKTNALTVKQTCDAYINTRKSLKPKTETDYRSIINTALSDWKDIPMAAITREMITKRHAKIGAKHPYRANNAFKLLSALFNFAIYQYADRPDPLKDNPVLVLTQTRAWFDTTRRHSKINHQQLPRWFKAVFALNNNTYNSIEISVKYYLILILFTGLRKEEAAPLMWIEAATPEALKKRAVSYLSLKDKMLFIDQSKNGLEHTLPLSDYIYELFNAYRNINHSRFVFPGQGSKAPIVEARKVIAKVEKISDTSFTLHDLRRTFATMANEIRIPAYTIKRLLNHKTANSDVTAGYIIDDVDYLRDPVNRIANYILEIARHENG